MKHLTMWYLSLAFILSGSMLQVHADNMSAKIYCPRVHGATVKDLSLPPTQGAASHYEFTPPDYSHGFVHHNSSSCPQIVQAVRSSITDLNQAIAASTGPVTIATLTLLRELLQLVIQVVQKKCNQTPLVCALLSVLPLEVEVAIRDAVIFGESEGFSVHVVSELSRLVGTIFQLLIQDRSECLIKSTSTCSPCCNVSKNILLNSIDCKQEVKRIKPLIVGLQNLIPLQTARLAIDSINALILLMKRLEQLLQKNPKELTAIVCIMLESINFEVQLLIDQAPTFPPELSDFLFFHATEHLVSPIGQLYQLVPAQKLFRFLKAQCSCSGKNR